MNLKRPDQARGILSLWLQGLLLRLALAFGLLSTGVPALAEEMDLAEHGFELSSAKFKMKLFRHVLPRGFKAAEHIHDRPGPRYVIKGRVRVLSEGSVAEYGPGEVFWEMNGTFMLENISAGDVDLLMVEMIPEALPPKPVPPPVRKKAPR